ncbi:MAG: PAS domain S-box protein [bacterium]
MAELDSISRETDPQLFFEALLGFGQRCERDGQIETAASVYSLLSEGTGFPAFETRSLARLRAIEGVGPAGARAEFLMRRLTTEATDPAMLLSMGLAGAAFRVTRLAVLGRLASSPVANAFTRGLGARLAASGAGFLVESSTFTLAGHGLLEALGRPQDWSLRRLGRDWASGALALGSLKFFGWAGGRLYQRTRGLEPWAANAAPSWGQILFQQGSMLSGILAAQRLETAVGLREGRDGATTLVDGLATLLQFNVAGRLTHTAFGEGWSRWERGLEIQSARLTRGLTRFQDGPWHPPGTGGLVWASVTPPGTGEAHAESRDPQRPWLVLMERDEGMEGGSNGTATRPPEPPIPRAPEAPDAEPSEAISWLPKSPQQLAMALRELLNMHPHAAAVFELSAPENGGAPGGQVLMINGRLTELFGYSEVEAQGLTLQDFMHRKDIPFFRDLSRQLMEHGTLDQREVRFRHKDGSSIWCDATGMVKRVNGRSLGFAFLEDISERRRAQAELRASEARNRALIDAIPDQLFRVRGDEMSFQDYRSPQEGLFPVTRDQLIGMRIADLPVPEELKETAYRLIRRALETGELQSVEYEIPMPDGSMRVQEARISRSAPQEVVIFVRDLTEQKRLEQHRIAAGRLDALKLVSRGLAHDANNALTATTGYLDMARTALEQLQGALKVFSAQLGGGAQGPLSQDSLNHLIRLHRLLERDAPSPTPLPSNPAEILLEFNRALDKTIQDLRTAGEQGDRIKNIISGFRELTSEPKSGPPFDLHGLLRSQELRLILGSGRDLNLHLTPDPWQVPGPRENIHRVILNLVGNARDAMEGLPHQALTVQTEKVSLSGEEVATLARLSPEVEPNGGGDFMRLRVRDTGAGIPLETLPRIFEPYFSTKAKTHDSAGHSGLGLAITRKMVQDAGGFIAVESRPGEGTTFDVYLPRVKPAAELQGTQFTERIFRTPILVVDDEPMLRVALQRNLEALGFETVFQAGNAREALDQLEAHPEIGGLIFDQNLPDMRGMQLLREARLRRPNLPSLLFTGDGAESLRPYLANFTDAIEKPSGMDQVRDALFGVMGKYFQAQDAAEHENPR